MRPTRRRRLSRDEDDESDVSRRAILPGCLCVRQLSCLTLDVLVLDSLQPAFPV